jgi:C-terminal processing protease CtpA/Prc
MTRRARMVAIALAIAVGGCRGPNRPQPTDRVANLHAFARLYGVVRWFHPSDAAAAIDWDRFAAEGALRVLSAPDRDVLLARLEEVFAPVAPTVTYAKDGDTLADAPALRPASTAGLDVVAWEHEGYGESGIASVYQSKRRHRVMRRPDPEAAPFAVLSQHVDATPYRGKRVRLRGQLRTANGGRGQLWLRVDRGETGRGFFDNTNDRPVKAETWTPLEITGDVAADATSLVFGILDMHEGEVFVDAIELAYEAGPGEWTPIPVADAGFEAADHAVAWHSAEPPKGWAIRTVATEPAEGKSALALARNTVEVSTELFPDEPPAAQVADVDLGAGLRARVPITLYAKGDRTVGDDPAVARATQATPGNPPPSALASAVDVIIAWNVLQHFWPYWVDVENDWNAALDVALADALDDATMAEHAKTLQRLGAAAPDGHTWVGCSGVLPATPAPFRVAEAEGKVIVTASADPQLRAGDVITAFDGVPIADVLAREQALASGAPQWTRYRVLRALGEGPANARLVVGVTRGDDLLNVSITRGDAPVEAVRPAVEVQPDGVVYVDVSRLEDVEPIAAQLAAAPGVVLDLRGYPKGGAIGLLSHLISAPDTSTAWMRVTRILWPDHAAGPGTPAVQNFGWELQPLAPHIDPARVVWLTGGGAISYAESVMSLVDHYGLGTIVGGPTAGTNGNIARIDLPGGCTYTFTGMRVVRHDGTRYHLLGVVPDVAAERTVAGIVAGTDEVLEKGFAVVRAAGKASVPGSSAPKR